MFKMCKIASILIKEEVVIATYKDINLGVRFVGYHRLG